jgi:RNA polymerase sigma-70 factor (ECF subfamily)
MQDLEVISQYLETQASMCFSLLYSRYAPKIYGKCLTILKDEALAEDATQEIFMKIFVNLSRFEEKAKFSTWIYSITYNFCIDYLRRKQKEDFLFTDDMEKTADFADDIPDELLMEIEVQQLRRVLEEIPADDRTILLMKYQDDMSVRDIADVLNKTESAVKMKIKRAKEKAQRIKDELFSNI